MKTPSTIRDIVSKNCADYLREKHPALKAAHAREIVAAYFGYKSHAALLSSDDVTFQAKAKRNDVYISTRVKERMAQLSGLLKLDPIILRLDLDAAFSKELLSLWA